MLESEQKGLPDIDRLQGFSSSLRPTLSRVAKTTSWSLRLRSQCRLENNLEPGCKLSSPGITIIAAYVREDIKAHLDDLK